MRQLSPGVRVRPGSNAPVLEIWQNGGSGTVLFYPGTMLAPGHYSTFISALLDSGLAVAGLHLSGHGACGKKGKFVFSDLLDQGLLAEAWLLDNGFAPVAVCGHSQGGILTLAHAGASASLTAAFAISAVFPRMAEAISLTRFAPLAGRRESILAAIKRLAAVFPSLPVPLPVYLRLSQILAGKKEPLYMGREKGRVCYPLAFLASLFDAEIDSRLNCPFWLLGVDNDALFTRELTQSVFDKIDAPAKTLVRIPEGGHMAPLNPSLAQFAARHIAAACAGLGVNLNLAAGAD